MCGVVDEYFYFFKVDCLCNKKIDIICLVIVVIILSSFCVVDLSWILEFEKRK